LLICSQTKVSSNAQSASKTGKGKEQENVRLIVLAI